MNFTRDPIIETIITPKEGFKLVLRGSKGQTQEEFVVDSVQVVLLGANCFYRSLEKPKAFLVPASDYEVLEVRETRMVMKLPGSEKGGIKIGGGREKVAPREPREEEEELPEKTAEEAQPERVDQRRKEKKRFRRRGRDRFEKEEGEAVEGAEHLEGDEPPPLPREEKPNLMIPPPSTLISETIARYKGIPDFAAAFFEKEKETEEKEVSQEEVTAPPSTSVEGEQKDTEFFL